MGDITSAGDYLAAVDAAGFAKAAGFNFDCSHMEWQGVSGVDFIRAYGDRIHCAHIKGVQVGRRLHAQRPAGRPRPMGDKHNGWNFVTAGTARDATTTEELFVELNRAGFSGGVSIEWEDNDVEQHAGAKAALANVHRADQPPSGMRHDEQLESVRQIASWPPRVRLPRRPRSIRRRSSSYYRGNYATELLTAAVAHFRIFEPPGGPARRRRRTARSAWARRAAGRRADLGAARDGFDRSRRGRTRLRLTPLAREHLVARGRDSTSAITSAWRPDSPGVARWSSG